MKWLVKQMHCQAFLEKW